MNLSCALLLVGLPALAGAQSLDSVLTPEGLHAALAGAQSAAQNTQVRPPAYPVVVQIPLGSPVDYWNSALTFQAEGETIHLSGSKDGTQGDHDGYFFSMLEDGQTAPIWVTADTSPVPFQIKGKTYFIKIDLSIKTALLHVERLKIVITKKDDPSYHVEVLAGQIAAGLIGTGRPLTLLGQEKRALYMQDIVEVKRGQGQPSTTAPREGHHTLMLGQVFPYTFNGSQTCDKFDFMIFAAEAIEGRYPDGSLKLWPKAMGKQKVAGKDRVITYGFHIEDDASGRKTLVVYDMTDPAPAMLVSR